MNLSCVYLSLCNDTGFRGVQASAWGNQCNVPCKQSYERQCKFIFSIMDTFYNKNIHKAITDVQDFYVRNELGVRDENGIVNICITLDGAYGRRGRESTYCISVAIDVWTGRVVDFHFCVKCFSCDNNNDYNTNGTCPYGLFHGASGSMERYNAVVLFGRSEARGLRYTTYIADGDCKILPKLHELDPYPGIIIDKVECANHLGKRCHKALVKFGEKWTLAKGNLSTANRGRGRGNGRGRGRGGRGRGRGVGKGGTAAADPVSGPMDRFLMVDPEVERLLSPFTNPSTPIQPDTNIPPPETPEFQTDTELADASAAGPNSTDMPTYTHDTPRQDRPPPTQDIPAPIQNTTAPTQDIQASRHGTTTSTQDTHVPTNVASTPLTRSAPTKRKSDDESVANRGRGNVRGRGRGKEVVEGEKADVTPVCGPMDRFLRVDLQDEANQLTMSAARKETAPLGRGRGNGRGRGRGGRGRGRGVGKGKKAAAAPVSGPMDRFLRVDPEVEQILSPFTNTCSENQPDTAIPPPDILAPIQDIPAPTDEANQLTITSALRSAARREAAPLVPQVIDDPQDDLNGCFVFEEDLEGISVLLDDISKDPMYLPNEDSEGLIAVAEDEMLDSETISALLEDWEIDGSVCGESAIDAAASPLTSANPPNGPTRVPSTASEVVAEVLADTATEAAAPGSSDTNTLGTLYVNHNWPLPDFLKKYHHRPTATYKIKPLFTSTKMYRIESKYKLAVYKHRHEGPEAQHRAVMSVLYHECDHPQTSLAQREWYHRYCDDGCGYQQWVRSGKPGENYAKKSYMDAQKQLHDWEHGNFAGVDTAYPSAFRQLVYVFDKLGNRELMARCRTLRTQNANESVHSKVFNILKKIKDHGPARFKFGCQQVMLDHNYGVLNASLLNCLGTMSTSARVGHENLVKIGTRSSERVYERSKGGSSTSTGISHRKKVHYKRLPRATAAAVPSAGTSCNQRPQQSGRFTESGHYSYGGGD